MKDCLPLKWNWMKFLFDLISLYKNVFNIIILYSISHAFRKYIHQYLKISLMNHLCCKMVFMFGKFKWGIRHSPLNFHFGKQLVSTILTRHLDSFWILSWNWCTDRRNICSDLDKHYLLECCHLLHTYRYLCTTITHACEITM